VNRLNLKERLNKGYVKFIYVCSPYRGDVVINMNFAQECCRMIFKQHDVPIAPHLYFPMFMNDNIKEVREFAFELNKLLIDMCDYMIVFGLEVSEGMQMEIDYAHSIRKKVIKCAVL